uniref:INSM transcriptional repressor 2 n=1 Tax=Salarias fasciatus TaxID=181472 RepID=A0A672GPC2_SALFA
MPRGFLVKRNRRGYRSRSGNKPDTCDADRSGSDSSEADTLLAGLHFQPPGGEFPVSREDSSGVREAWSPHVESALEAEADRRAQLPESEVDVLGPDDDFSCFFPPPPPPPPPSHDLTLTSTCSPVKPVGTRLLEQHEGGEKPPLFTGRCLTSSPAPELPDLPLLVSSTPTSVSASIERLLATGGRHHHHHHHHHAQTYEPRVAHLHLFPPLTLMNQEQHHAARKRAFLEADPRLNGSRHGKQPAGGATKKVKVNRKLNFEDEVTTSPFICQLCKEEYPDPFSLAQHKCSRIVRVEYRCPECDKVFSCPANLASHRRWHKPRPVSHQARAADSPPSGLLRLSDEPQLQQPLPPVQSLPEEELYECRYCGKKFRRQAYLKKHLAAHEMSARASPPPYVQTREPGGGQSQQVFLCHLCGARFPSVEIRDKHRPDVFHQQQIFTCKHCPSTFFSSPGLTRHINKSHPTENRQVMLLQMTVRP